jgi:hypothetical protein
VVAIAQVEPKVLIAPRAISMATSSLTTVFSAITDLDTCKCEIFTSGRYAVIDPRNTSDAPGTIVKAWLKPPAVKDSAVDRVSPRSRNEL